jgi:preprotein translocase subunit SecG
MLMNLLLVIEVIVAVFLIVVVLLQRSEGGGLVSGGTSSLVSVRGAGDLLTRTTWILGAIFFTLALALAIVAGRGRSAASVVDRLKVNAVNPAELTKPAPTPPAGTAIPGSTDEAPGPLQAPTPTINSPFGTLPATPAPAQQAPAPAAPTPTAPAKK